MGTFVRHCGVSKRWFKPLPARTVALTDCRDLQMQGRVSRMAAINQVLLRFVGSPNSTAIIGQWMRLLRKPVKRTWRGPWRQAASNFMLHVAGHVLPTRFVLIRYFGQMAKRWRGSALPCQLLA